MKVTEQAREKLQQLLSENPGKCLRVVIEGFG
jgi:Fe-S cluster assembly iron-binding protein IscA